MARSRLAVAVLLASALTVCTACSVGARRTVVTVGALSPGSGEATPTRTNAGPSPSATSHPSRPTPRPSKATTKPTGTKKSSDQSTGGTNTVGLPVQKGHGPGGSMMATGSTAVALTFDDGPNSHTAQMLDLLKANHVHATFCLVGTQVRQYPALVRRIVAEGHTLCNHTWHHDLHLAEKSDAQIRADLQQTNDEIRKAAPGAKISYFRAPGGNFTTHLVAIAQSMGMTSLYWSVDPRDWDHVNFGWGAGMVSHIISAVEHNARQGSIILSHDIYADTVTAYRTLVPWLKKRFTLIPLPVHAVSSGPTPSSSPSASASPPASNPPTPTPSPTGSPTPVT